LEKPIKLNGGILVDWRVKNMEFSTISQCCGYGGKKNKTLLNKTAVASTELCGRERPVAQYDITLFGFKS
jgi:hypothetical protein